MNKSHRHIQYMSMGFCNFAVAKETSERGIH